MSKLALIPTLENKHHGVKRENVYRVLDIEDRQEPRLKSKIVLNNKDILYSTCTTYEVVRLLNAN